ncbi:MAG: ABC transporter ATP-binding protein [Patescibacteria group bacterium]
MHLSSSDHKVNSRAIRRVLRDYGRQYRAHPWLALGSFMFPAIGTIFVFFIPPLFVAEIVNKAASNTLDLPHTLPLIGLFGASWIFGELLWRVGIHFMIKLEAKGKQLLGETALADLLGRDYDFFTDNFVGSLTKKALAYARGFETFTDIFAFNILTNLFPLIFALIVLSRYSWILPAVLLGAVLLVISVSIPIIRMRSHLVAERHAAGSKVSGTLSDALTNVIMVKSYAREGAEEARNKDDLTAYVSKFTQAANFQNLRLETILSPLYVLTNVIGLTLVIFLAAPLGLAVGTLLVVFSYYTQVTRVFWEINHIYRQLESSVTEAAEFAELMLEKPTITDSVDAAPLVVQDAQIHFNAITFRYGEAREPFFKNFSFSIKSGERVGLVGPSGGGKTTITKLLLRFAEVEAGVITIDGQDITKVTQQSLRSAVGYVPQEPLLFHRSLFDNIAYGSVGASRKEVERAATLAHAHDFITTLPQGYETLVGERGVKLSGGQRQRVAIARAILKNAPILVLDEATSALDSESEKYIQEGLWELMQGKTAIVIAHRLSTIKHLDRIVVLNEGAIVEEGTHDELLRQNGVYAKLWGHQSGGFLED